MAARPSSGSIEVVPLGAGQDVGRSCVVVSMGGKTVMFDCGMHMGFVDSRRFPDFSLLSPSGKFNEVVDAVIISHFHLDHCGALPHFTEMCGYTGPLIMTAPTRAICPVLLEDFRKITVERRGETNFFTSEMIAQCMSRVTEVAVHETLVLAPGFEVTCFYAGHVLGAAMFRVRVGDQSVVYTGDYNMTPDRHLGAAWIDAVRPDLLITESTYATVVRDSKRCREQDFLVRVKDCVERGGKVLIPVFALGRAQELCVLIDTFWTRMGLRVPIYFAQGLTGRATEYYKLFIEWTNQQMKQTFVERNKFDFQHIRPFEKAMMFEPGPMVVFATPGMLHAGLSLEIFRAWAPSPDNMVIMPGYCVAGTVGSRVLAGHKVIEIEGTQVHVRCQVAHLSFSAHADAKGIMQLIRQAQPRAVMLVHGDRHKMVHLKQRIEEDLGLPCFCPANGTTVAVPPCGHWQVRVSSALVEQSQAAAWSASAAEAVVAAQRALSAIPAASASSSSSSSSFPAVAAAAAPPPPPAAAPGTTRVHLDGVLVVPAVTTESETTGAGFQPSVAGSAPAVLMGADEAWLKIGRGGRAPRPHVLRFTQVCPMRLDPNPVSHGQQGAPSSDLFGEAMAVLEACYGFGAVNDEQHGSVVGALLEAFPAGQGWIHRRPGSGLPLSDGAVLAARLAAASSSGTVPGASGLGVCVPVEIGWLGSGRAGFDHAETAAADLADAMRSGTHSNSNPKLEPSGCGQ